MPWEKRRRMLEVEAGVQKKRSDVFFKFRFIFTVILKEEDDCRMKFYLSNVSRLG